LDHVSDEGAHHAGAAGRERGDSQGEFIADVQAVLARDAFRFGFLQHFEGANVDVVLSLPGAGPANKLNTSTYWSYTALWNLLDYPAGVFPTGLAVLETDVPDAPYEFWSEEDEMVWKTCESAVVFRRILTEIRRLPGVVQRRSAFAPSRRAEIRGREGL
jgi:hypothetical protein